MSKLGVVGLLACKTLHAIIDFKEEKFFEKKLSNESENLKCGTKRCIFE